GLLAGRTLADVGLEGAAFPLTQVLGQEAGQLVPSWTLICHGSLALVNTPRYRPGAGSPRAASFAPCCGPRTRHRPSSPIARPPRPPAALPPPAAETPPRCAAGRAAGPRPWRAPAVPGRSPVPVAGESPRGPTRSAAAPAPR